MTVGELKKLIQDIPDSTPVATFRSNMEGSGYTDKYIRVKLQKMFRYKEKRVDSFDGTEYTVDVLSSYPMDHLENKQEINCLIVD